MPKNTNAADRAGSTALNQFRSGLIGGYDAPIIAQAPAAAIPKFTCHRCAAPATARAFTVRVGLPPVVRPICARCARLRACAPRDIGIALRLACALARVAGKGAA